jgi:MATE family multidrug resistance protein
MLTPERVKTISKLAVPFAIAISSEFVLALIDLAMVGTLGNNAVAGVGVSAFCYTFIIAFVTGISPAVQGIVARRRGESSTEPLALPLNTGLSVALLIGAPIGALCYLFTPFFFSLISSDPHVTAAGVPYLRLMYVGIVGVGLNGAFRGFWAGMEKPKILMSIVVLMSALNILLNYAFIFGHFGAPALGVRGAALGTVLSVYTGVLTNCVLAFILARNEGFLTVKPQIALLKRIVQIGLPASMQEFFFSAGYITFFWMVGQVGTAELAAANVLIRVTMVMALLAMALGVASATLVSRTVGEGDVEGASRWGWDTAKLGVISISALGLPLLLFPERFLSLFLTDPHTLAITILPLQMVAVTSGIGSMIYIFGYTLYSVGDGNRVVLVSLSAQWAFFLPLVYLVGPYLKLGLLQIWFVQMAYGTLATILIVTIWINGRWKRITI